MEPVHEYGEALVKLAPPGLGLIHPEVDARIEIEQEVLQPYFPATAVVIAVEQVAQGFLGECAWDPAQSGSGPGSFRASRTFIVPPVLNQVGMATKPGACC